MEGIIYKKNKLPIHSETPYAGRSKGLHRQILQYDLKGEKAYKYDIKKAGNNSRHLVKGGNLQEFKNVSTLRKIRSESLAKLNRHSDELIDVILMRRDDNENFIQKVGEPFFVHMTSKEQSNVLKLYINNYIPILINNNNINFIFQFPQSLTWALRGCPNLWAEDSFYL